MPQGMDAQAVEQRHGQHAATQSHPHHFHLTSVGKGLALNTSVIVPHTHADAAYGAGTSRSGTGTEATGVLALPPCQLPHPRKSQDGIAAAHTLPCPGHLQRAGLCLQPACGVEQITAARIPGAAQLASPGCAPWLFRPHTMPCAIMARATFMKPATLAPRT